MENLYNVYRVEISSESKKSLWTRSSTMKNYVDFIIVGKTELPQSDIKSITKWGSFLLLQSETTVITKWDHFIINWNVYYKVGQLLQRGP